MAASSTSYCQIDDNRQFWLWKTALSPFPLVVFSQTCIVLINISRIFGIIQVPLSSEGLSSGWQKEFTQIGIVSFERQEGGTCGFFFCKKSILKKTIRNIATHGTLSTHWEYSFDFLVIWIVVICRMDQKTFSVLQIKMLTVMFIGICRCSLWDGIVPRFQYPVIRDFLLVMF